MDAQLLLELVVPLASYVLVLAWFAFLARRWRLPVAAFTAVAGAVLGTFWQWVWLHLGPVGWGFNPIPTVVGLLLSTNASRWFMRDVPNVKWSNNFYESRPVGVNYTPSVLLFPQNSIILSGVLWGLVGLIVGMVAARRWAHE